MFSISKRPTINEIHNLYKTKKALPSEVTKFFINRIVETDKKLNSFTSTCEDYAQEVAALQDLEIINNPQYHSEDETAWSASFEDIVTKQPLFGIPFAIKSIIQVEGIEFNSSSKILQGYKAPYSSTVYTKIAQAGAILLGVNNNDEFAMGSSGENSAFGATKNPFDTNRVPGGSSSGGASCVGGGLVVFSLGTDTGGSIRQPAAFTDTVGLKPTYGLVSRWGVIPMASSFDQVGAFTNNVEDNIIVTNILAGLDNNDQTTINSEQTKKRLTDLYDKNVKNTFRQLSKIKTSKKPLKIGIPKEFYPNTDDGNFDKRIMDLLQELIQKLKSLGHTIVDVSIPLSKHAISVYYMTMSVEVASNLERIDGIRYAKQEDGKTDYKNLYFDYRSTYFGDEPKRRIILGTYASSSGYYDAYYNHAQKIKEITRQEFAKVLTEVDVLLTPTTPELPFEIGNKTTDLIKMYLSDVFTCGINPIRLPALNVPLGLVLENGVKLPTGCQIIGQELEEDKIFELALEIELLQKEKR